MRPGFHSRCPLTVDARSLSSYENHHYYYKSESLHLSKSPEAWAEKCWERGAPKSAEGGMAADGAMAWGAGCGMPW